MSFSSIALLAVDKYVIVESLTLFCPVVLVLGVLEHLLPWTHYYNTSMTTTGLTSLV